MNKKTSRQHKTLEALLKHLTKKGCYPGIYFRGFENKKPIWRAHVNCSGSCWDEAATPHVALRKAVKAWEKYG